MPLLDHFHPPLSERRHWQAFHSRWASALADDLNGMGLPENLFAEPAVEIGGQVQVDVATLDEGAGNGGAVGGITQAEKIAAPTWTIPALFLDSFEVKVFDTEGGPRLVAAIELVSPSNKDRPQARRAFAIKCASYLCQGVAAIVVDVVTSRSANLHNEIMELLQTADYRMSPRTKLYATAYRPVRRDGREEIDAWSSVLRLGTPLPALPLFLGADLSVSIDLEASYQETCQRLRFAPSNSARQR